MIFNEIGLPIVFQDTEVQLFDYNIYRKDIFSEINVFSSGGGDNLEQISKFPDSRLCELRDFNFPNSQRSKADSASVVALLINDIT